MAHPARARAGAALVCALTSLLLGWSIGFRDLAAYVVFWALGASVGVSAMRIVRRLFPWRGLVDAIVRGASIAFALIVAAGFLLGVTGLIGPIAYLILAAACVAVTTRLRTATRAPQVVADPPLHLAIVLCAMLAFVVAVGLVQSPLTLYDSLSYHLLFPARWLQEHRLSIVPTPFSDEAQAYAPANGELFFLWLMAPFHGDLAARIGQLPFYLLIAAALYALARRLGAPPAHAAYVPAFALLSRPIVEQAVGADVDLVCWSMLLTALYLGFVAIESNDAAEWALWGVVVGLYAGTKYVSLVYAPVLVAQAAIGMRWRGGRATRSRAMLWALPGLLVFGAPWYLRNWIVAGSPIYPSSLTIAGVTLAPGAYTHAAMNHSLFHTTDPRLLPVMLAHAFGTPLILFWLPSAAIGGWAMASARPRREAWLLLAAPLVMIPLYWFAIPDNVDSRFMLPIALLALLPLAFVFRSSRGWTIAMHAALCAGLVWIVVGRDAELPARLPYFMGGWLSLQGIVSRAFLAAFAALALLTGSIAYAIVATGRRGVALTWPALIAIAAIECAAATIGAERWCAPGPCALLAVSPTFIRSTTIDAWEWSAANIHGATIAYTGNNLPYPLAGDHLTNRVVYVNIDRHADWRFHDYDRAHRRRRDDAPPAAALATPSGVLVPIAGPARWHVDAVRPRYERMQGDRAAWLANLRASGVDRLFVSALSAYEIDYVAHNDGGFPIEDDWARADLSTFTLIYENPQIRIYAVGPGAQTP